MRAYDIGLLLAGLDHVLDLMGFDSRFEGCRFGRPARLYLKALALKEVCKASLRYAESLSQIHLGVRIPKSTLHYWEARHGDVVREVLKVLLRLLSTIDYDYSVVDSTKFTDWLKGLHELFIDVRVRGGETLFPVHAQLTSSEVEFVKGIPEGGGVMLGDGAFDAKPVLNTIASKGYIPMVKRGSRSPRGYGARIRDRAYDEALYAYRGVGEGIFGALTVEFGERLKTRRRESTKTRTHLRIIIYCLKILVRWTYE
ncbi:MAG: hypothetical protein LM601_08590 [Candidatus Verstraetearchaeota archaeon]|nr:hypothetical protein [Candidatus Verstraetearchaeota archaeon]